MVRNRSVSASVSIIADACTAAPIIEGAAAALRGAPQAWAAAIALALIPPIAAIGLFAVYAGLMFLPVDISRDWQMAAYLNAAATSVIMLLAIMFGSLIVPIAVFTAIDRSFGYSLSIEQEGVRMKGVLMSRLLEWREIRDIRFRRGRWVGWADTFMVGHIAIYVDGSHNPRRHWSSVWFGYYDIPPLMTLPAGDLTALLRHSKQGADTSWRDPSPRK